MTDAPPSAEDRLNRLLERLLAAAEASLAAGDLEPARSTAEEVRAVDPENARASRILQQVAARQLSPFGERALMTLLFSDLADSTMLSEQVEPERLRDLFAVYRSAAREAVERYSGNVVQYSGDGILAAFGHPEPHEDDARRAVLAGLDLVVTMKDARAELQRRLGVAPAVRVGIHTGRVVVTDMSDDPSVIERDSIVGVVPNLAARIQQAAAPDSVVISDVTQQLVDSDFFLRSLGEEHLKGISRPVEVFAVERPRWAGARFESERYRKAGLVGRDDPRDRILGAWESVRAGSREEPGSGSLFLVAGEAGIGKSRLVAEIVDRVEASGGNVLGVGCLPYYANVSLWPVARGLERLLATTGSSDRLSALVAHVEQLGLGPARFVPFLAPLLGVADQTGYPVPELDPSAFLDETLTRLVEWVAALSSRTPHLLVVEDVHWADPSTLALLGRLAERQPAALLTVATTREPAAVPWAGSATVLRLSRLDVDASHRLIDNLVGDLELSEAERSTIVTQAEGVPLFVEELTRTRLDTSRSEPVPLRLQELFTWRLRAPGVDPRVVQVAATIGPAFASAVLADVVGDEAAVREQLDVLVAEGIVESGGDPAAGTYRFRHALMRDAAYETQVLDVRARTHAAIAETLARSGAEPALVATHLDLAGIPDRAVELYVAAAQAEQGRGAHTEAAKLLSRAIELVEELEAADSRDLTELTARMLRGLSVSSTQGYASPDVQDDHRRAEELATRLGARPEVLPSLIAIWSYWLVSGELGTARSLIDRLADMAAQPAFAWFSAEVASCAGWQDFYEGHLPDARDHLETAMAGFRMRPAHERVSPFWPLPHDPVAVNAIALACVNTLMGDLDRAREWEGEAYQRTAEIGFPRRPFSLAFVKTYAAWIHRFLGDAAGAQRLGGEVVALGQQHGYLYWVTLGSAYLATATPGGAPDRAHLEEVITTLRLMGQEAFAPSSLSYLAQLAAAEGDVDAARGIVADALVLVHKSGEHLHLPELLRLRSRYTMAGGGDPAEAAADLDEATRVAVEQSARVSRLRAALERATLPDEQRPPDWRAELEAARADLPGSFDGPEARDADAALARTGS